MPRVLITDAIGVDVDHLDVPGSMTIGNDAATDTLEVVAAVSSDLIPDGNGTRSLGSPTAQWNIHGSVTDGVTETQSVAFTHTLGAAGEYITVWTYPAADYVGGHLKVYIRDGSNSGIAEYLFLNNTTVGVGGASITHIKRHNLNNQTIDSNQRAEVVAGGGSPDFVRLEVQSGTGGSGTDLDIMVTIELVKEVS